MSAGELTVRRAQGAAVLLLAGVAGFLALRAFLERDADRAARRAHLESIEEAFEIEGDPGAALRLAVEGIERWPGDGRFHLWRARALAARGRLSQALEAYGDALARTDADEPTRRRILLEQARVRWLLYRETREREQLQRAEADLDSLRLDPELGPEASILMGLLRAERGAPGDREVAASALEDGLGRLVEARVLTSDDLERARETLNRLRRAGG